MEKKYILSLDIGGTYIKYAIMNNNYEIIQKDKLPNPMDDDFNSLESALRFIFKKTGTSFKIEGVAISTFGVVNKKNDNIFWTIPKKWKYRNFKFKEIFNNLPMYIENDVNSAMIGEKYFGKIKDQDDIFMITLGTGIGGAMIINNNLYTGNNNFAGEVGSMLINNTRWEDIASVRAFLNNLPESLKVYSLSEILEISNKNKIIFNYVDEWYKNIAIGIVNICFMFNPKKFIIGGGISSNKNFSINRIMFHIDKLIHNKFLINYYTLQKASLGNDAALYGAAYLYFHNFKHNNL